jgi:acetylornithine/N-succinyldiaminopimelate aminotransferase
VTVAKPLAGGLPLGAVLFSEAVYATFPQSAHATTFGGGPLVCRVALEFLTVMETLLGNVRDVGGFCEKGLRELAQRHSTVTEVRARGMMLAMKLRVPGDPIVDAARERGLLINCTQGNVLRFLPPFILSRDQAQEALQVLDEILP